MNKGLCFSDMAGAAIPDVRRTLLNGNRGTVRVALSIIPFLLALVSTWAQTGTIEKVTKKGRAQVNWAFLGAKPSQLGVLLEYPLAVGVFRVLDSEGHKGTIELIDTGAEGVFKKGRDVRLLEVSHPTVEPEKATILVWSQELEATVLVDGSEVGKSPIYLNLEPGTHEIAVRLVEGGSAGARVELTRGADEVLYLFGFQREVSARWNPAYLLEVDRRDKTSANKMKALQWIDDPSGTRVYFGFPPVEHPVITHSVKPIYPSDARNARIMGNVALEAIVGSDGQVHGARVIASQDTSLAQAALEAVQQWIYKPGTLEGKAVPVVFTIQVEFSLSSR